MGAQPKGHMSNIFNLSPNQHEWLFSEKLSGSGFSMGIKQSETLCFPWEREVINKSLLRKEQRHLDRVPVRWSNENMHVPAFIENCFSWCIRSRTQKQSKFKK